MSKNTKTITYKDLLKEVEECFNVVEKTMHPNCENNTLRYENMSIYLQRAEHIIELLEIDICGVPGEYNTGFDKGQIEWSKLFNGPYSYKYIPTGLYKRYLWIKEHYEF